MFLVHTIWLITVALIIQCLFRAHDTFSNSWKFDHTLEEMKRFKAGLKKWTMITKQCLTVAIKLSTVLTMVPSVYLPDHTSIRILAIDITSSVFNVFSASCTEVYTKLQYSLTNIVVLIICYIVAKIHFAHYSEHIHLCRVCSPSLAHHCASLLTSRSDAWLEPNVREPLLTHMGVLSLLLNIYL